ncbi:hypothetical protein QJQ45_022866, partial [Haematococcus lacustris]
MHTDIDLLNPPAELEKSKHKLKRLVQPPPSRCVPAVPQQLLHGCEVPGLLQYVSGVQVTSQPATLYVFSSVAARSVARRIDQLVPGCSQLAMLSDI